VSAILEHLRTRRKVALLAAGVLDGDERAWAERHVERCARCRAERDELLALVRAMEEDPLREAVPGVPASAFAAQVERALDRALAAPSGRPRWFLVALPAAATVVAVSLLAPAVVGRMRPTPAPTLAPIPRPPADAAAAAVSTEEALARIERNLAREHAARYLADAGDVIVTVAASAADCDRASDRLDVGEAPERSRELLEKRRLVVDAGGEAVASAQGVLDDVELALREVSTLPSCVRRRDVDRLRRAVEDRQLLMRIRLMTRELEG
jgi:hypothetical protein